MPSARSAILFAAIAAILAFDGELRSADLPESLRFEVGAVNSVAIVRGGARLAVNRDVAAGAEGEPERILLTHARREVVEAARASGAEGRLHAPAASREFLEGAAAFWEGWWRKRFDYYEQQSTRRPLVDLPAQRYLENGDRFEWRGLEFRFLATPGYTRDGGTYLVELDGRKVAFSGELVLEGGRVSDLHSFQEAIPDAKIGGYHGYLGRIAQWLASVEALAAEKPDLVVPSRGALVLDPTSELSAAAALAREVYRAYLETNALHWYFGKDRMGACAELVLGPGHGVSAMPLAEHVDLPEWCHHIGTTKLLVSASRRGFVLDVGGPTALGGLAKLVEEGLVAGIDGIFATHAHNDHTASIAEAQRRFGCPVYATPEVAPVLERPGDWFLPGVSPNAVDAVETKDDGEKMRWEEFELTFRSFPGQMLNHGALLVERPGEEAVFFIGDSFSPSGIDDYCMMNRNLMREGAGYRRCFDILEELPGSVWLVNQHIPHRFRFTPEERSFLLGRYGERASSIARLVAWDDADFGVDPQWARLHPYGTEARPGGEFELSLHLANHGSEAHRFEVRLRGDLPVSPPVRTISVDPRGEGVASFGVSVPTDAAEGIRVVVADLVRDDGLELPAWCEALVRVARP